MCSNGGPHLSSGAPRINYSRAGARLNASGVRTNFTNNARTARFSGNRSIRERRSDNFGREHRRGNIGGGFGAGLPAGALIGGATYTHGGYPYTYGDYGYAAGYADYSYDDSSYDLYAG